MNLDISTRLLETRRSLRALLGADYAATVAPFRMALAEAAAKEGLTVLQVAIRCAVAEQDEFAWTVFMSAAVDEIEAEGKAVA